MTLESCKKYLEEAKTDEEKLFWTERMNRKYPVIEEVKPEKPKKEVKK